MSEDNVPHKDSENSTTQQNTDETTNYPIQHVVTPKQLPSESRWYRRVFGKALDYAVTPKLIGNIPADVLGANNNNEDTPIVFYVLQERSRSNSQLVDNETRKLGLPAALAPTNTENFNEKASIIYIRHGQKTGLFAKKHAHSPRLFRILNALQKTSADVLLVPVSINWGRDPGKEDSLIKLLTAESWSNPTITKQLINIGVHGRDTYIQFHPSVNLRTLVTEATRKMPQKTAIEAVETHLAAYLKQQREIMIGPDLSDRRTEVDKILYSPAIKHAIAEESARTNKVPKELREQVRGYMNEIVSDYSPTFVRMCEHTLSWLWTQLYDGVNVHHFDGVPIQLDDTNKQQDATLHLKALESGTIHSHEMGIRSLAEKYELIFLPCHRSHIDYLLIMYVLYLRGLRTPYVAAGDNLNAPVLGSLLRRGGAFFLRRKFNGNVLYTAVFREYLHNIISRNIPLKFFIEGGRSRTGRLLHPKTGMLAMTAHSRLREKKGKPIVYIPTYIGYERLAEGGSYVGEMQGKPKESESIFQLIKALRKIERIYGVVHVNFGEPIFLDELIKKHNVDASSYSPSRNDQVLDENVSNMVNDLGIKTMKNINKAAVVNPVSLLSLVLLSTPKHALTEASCIAQLDLYRELATKIPYDERTVLTEMTGKEIIEYGLKLKMITRVKHIMGDMISVADDQRMLLSYFSNNILHVFIMPSLVATLAHHNGRIQKDDILEIIGRLYPFIKFELFLKWKQSDIQPIVENIMDVMADVGLLMDDGKGMIFAETPNSVTNHQLSVLATPVQQSIKRYFIALALLNQQGSGNITAEQVADLCFLLGQRMSVLYEASSPEFFDKNLFRGFIRALIRNGYVQENEQKHLEFDANVINVAEHARFVLDEETLVTLEQLANLSEEEIRVAIAALEKKKQKRFSRKGK